MIQTRDVGTSKSHQIFKTRTAAPCREKMVGLLYYWSVFPFSREPSIRCSLYKTVVSSTVSN
ncbi:unnamed protein product [Ixodes pacificus]